MRLLLVTNVSASSVTARAKVVIGKALAADHRVTVAETSRRGHATRLAQGAAADGADVVVALGGDGTVNEVANGLAGTATALGVLPGGSTNVFARTIGMTNDPIEATGELLTAIASGSIRRVGLGSVNDRYFVFHAGIGLDAAVVARVEQAGRLKRYAGHPLFVWAALRTFFASYDRSRPHFAVRHADGSVIDDALFTLCQNTDPYTFLGNRPLRTAPDAGFDRGLTTLTFRSLGGLATVGYVVSALRSGRHLRASRHVVYRGDQGEIVVTAHGSVPYQVDGDYLGEAERLVVRHRPDCLRLVLP